MPDQLFPVNHLARRTLLWPVMLWLLSVGFLLFLTRPATAQVFVPSNSPGTGRVNTYPLGLGGTSRDFRTQIKVPLSFLSAGGSTIRDVALATAGKGSYTFASIEVRVGTLPPKATFDKTFATNIEGEKLVLQETNYRLHTIEEAWVDLGLASTFIHNGSSDLIIDILITGSQYTGPSPGTYRTTTTGSIEMVNRSNYLLSPKTTGYWYGIGPKVRLTTGTAPTPVVRKGKGCSGNGTASPTIDWQGSPKLNTTFTVDVKNAVQSSTAILLSGLEKTPGFDLTPIGAPGCTFNLRAIADVSAPTNAVGVASVALPVPNDPSLTGAKLSFQWVVPAVRANSLNLVLSPYIQITIL